MEIEWTDLAVASLEEIAVYISENFSEAIARKCVDEIVNHVKILETSPALGRPVSHLAKDGSIYCLNYKINQVYYRIINDHIQVILVWDGRQDPNVLYELVLGFLDKLEE